MYEELCSQTVRGSQLHFSVHHDPGEVLPWTVQYAGGGHYFQTAEDAVNYARKRKWITAAQAGKILDRLAEDLKEQ